MSIFCASCYFKSVVINPLAVAFKAKITFEKILK